MEAIGRSKAADLARRAGAWPQPIVSDRASVQVPESLGIRLRRDPDEFEVVVRTGGWADVCFLIDGEVYHFCPEFQDVDGAYGP